MHTVHRDILLIDKVILPFTHISSSSADIITLLLCMWPTVQVIIRNTGVVEVLLLCLLTRQHCAPLTMIQWRFCHYNVLVSLQQGPAFIYEWHNSATHTHTHTNTHTQKDPQNKATLWGINCIRASFIQSVSHFHQQKMKCLYYTGIIPFHDKMTG